MRTRRTSARTTLSRVAVVGIIVALAPLAAPGTAGASSDPPGGPDDDDSQGLEERHVPQKPDHAAVPEGSSQQRLHLKFVEGTDFRLRGNRFVSSDAQAEQDVADALAPFRGVQPQRLFGRPEQALAREKRRIERESGREQADKNLWYRLRLPRRVSAVDVMDALNALDVVETTYSEPLAAPPPETPDFEPDQNYRDPAGDGLDVDHAQAIPGGRGGNVRIIDIEYSWNTNHEDLSEARDAGASVNNGTPTDPFSNNDHGTAVLGELVADANGFGVTGIADQADLGMTNASNTEDGYDLADSIDTAHAALNDGDVILLEQQVQGANGGCNSMTQVGCVAVEYVQAYYDAIVSAVGDGIIVVEAAGNGNQDLDASEYNSTFGTRADSGAIIVGAGENCAGQTAHNRSSFSTYGSRVNLHGYGGCVMTTGYGARWGSSESNDAYTNGFGGTSSASPMVAGSAAVISSVAQQQGDADGLTSTQARARLAVGATPQFTGTGSRSGNIGPMPDLADALAAWVPTVSVGDATTPEGTDVGLSASGSDPQGDTLSYAWDLDDDGAFDDATGQTATFTDVGQDGSYPVTVRVTDEDGASSTDTATVTVTNVAPSVLNLANNAPVAEGSVLTQSGTVTDPGWLESLSLDIDWDDGSSDTFAAGQENTRPDATADFSRDHRYGDNGTYEIEVCGSDDDTSTCADTPAAITNVAPSVTIHADQVTAIDEGNTLSAEALFSDPGWQDTYTAAIDWGTGDGFEPVTPTVTTEGSAGTPDQGSAAGTHTYGDNGTFEVTVRVVDDDGGSGQASFEVTVSNVAPTSTIDLSGAQEINGEQTILATAGEIVAFSGDSTDPGSDDLDISWDWDDGLPSPDITTTYLVNPPDTDPPVSPSVQPRDVTDSQDHAFGDACMYLVTMGTEDDDGGVSSDEVNVLITGNADARRGAGYWYNQYRDRNNPNQNSLSPAQLDCYLAITDYVSDVFDEEIDASTRQLAAGVLEGKGPAAPPQLYRELLAAWLNFANGSIALEQMVDTDGNGSADTAFADVMADAEGVALDPGATEAEILATKDLLEAINLGQA